MHPREKNRLLLAIGGILGKVLKNSATETDLHRMRVFEIWDDIVGARIAAHTHPELFRNGTLTVKVIQATWQHELMFFRADIKRKLNHRLGHHIIKDIRFISGSKPPARAATCDTKPQNIQPRSEDYRIAHDIAAPITDPDVKAAFEQLVAKALYASNQSKDAGAEK